MTVHRVDWFRRDPTGGTVYVKPVSTTDESVSIDDSTDGADLLEVRLAPVDDALNGPTAPLSRYRPTADGR